MNHERIIAKGKYIFDMRLESPLSIGGSESEYTDHDVLRTVDGELFIPGTSIAGPIRSFCNEYFGKNVSLFSLDVESNDFFSSPFSVSDGVFRDKTKIKTSSRDGVAIKGYDENGIFEKTPKNTAKYDYEIIQKGANFRFVVEYTIREKYHDYLGEKLTEDSLEENLKEIEHQIKIIAKGFDKHLLSLGFKKSRGFGNVGIDNLTGGYFFGDSLKDWLSLSDESLRQIEYKDVDFLDKRKALIECKIKLVTPLSIRSYSDNLKDDFDFTQLSCDNNGKLEAVIPGTSIIGAIRHQMERIKKELGISSLDLNTLFGEVSGNNASQSKIKTDEIYLENGRFIVATRNSIDRFTGSSLDGHLFTQRIYVDKDGEFTLSFAINADIGNDIDLYPHIGLLLLALTDLQKGYCPLGGSAAIGYGIMLGEDPIKVNGVAIDINNNDYVDMLSGEVNQI